MTKLLISAMICIMAAGPAFPLTVGEILGRVPDEPVISPVNTESGALLSRSYAEERARAGAAFPRSPILIKETAPAPPEEPSREVVIVPKIVEQAIPYISAGSDGYGNAGERVYIGADTPAPTGASFRWEQLSGPLAEIDNPSSFTTFFITDEAGVCTFLLKADFTDGRAGFDTVVFIVDAPGINHVPTVSAGKDLSVEIGSGEFVKLQAAAVDADDDPLSFAWRQVGGPEVILYFGDTDRCEFLPEEEGVYIFEVTVTDPATASLPDSVAVICFLAGDQPPVAAVESQNIVLPPDGCIVQLDASPSYDPEGMPLLFAWEQTDGPPIQLSSTQVEKPYFLCEKEGDYWFELKVRDGRSESIPVEVSIHAAPAREEEAGGCVPGSNSSCGILLLLLLIGVAHMRPRFQVEKAKRV